MTRRAAEVVLAQLWAGNQVWSGPDAREPLPIAPEDASRLAAVVTCSDLSVAPEAVFGLRGGELVVAQSPGAWVNESVAETVEYGVRLHGVQLVVVLAHERCRLHDRTPAGPAASPTTALERLTVSVLRAARSRGLGAAQLCALRQARRVRELARLPPQVVVAPVVLRRDWTLELVQPPSRASDMSHLS